MNVTIQKLNGLWHLIVGSCQIRTPFLETQDRARVVAYARRIYPGEDHDMHSRAFTADLRSAVARHGPRSRAAARAGMFPDPPPAANA